MAKPSKRLTLACQRAYNSFIATRHIGGDRLELDGEWGPASKKAFQRARFYLGLRPGVGAGGQDNRPTEALVAALRDPRARIKGFSAFRHLERVRLAGKRQRNRRKEMKSGGSVMKIAASYVGKTENNNRAPWLDALARKYVGSWMVGQPWCGLFCIWVWARAGKKLPQGVVYTPNIVAWARRGQHFRAVSPSSARAGDLVVFNFPGGSSVADHVALARGPARGGVIPTIEGNTSPGAGGSQANGGGVYRRSRPVGLIAVVARPK